MQPGSSTASLPGLSGKSGDWMRVLFEAIDDAVFLHDADGNILEANSAACRRLGYRRDELLRLKTSDIDDPLFAQGFQERLDMQLKQGGLHCEGRHRAKDGHLIPVDINTSSFQLDGNPVVLAVMRDITARKHAEEQLASQSRLLQSIMAHLADALVVTDPQGRLLLFNPLAQQWFALGAKDIGRPLQAEGFFLADKVTPVPPADLPLMRALRGEDVYEVELYLRRGAVPAGLWLSAAARALREKDGAVSGGILVCRDITERKHAESRLAAQYAIARVLAEGETLEQSARHILQVLCDCLGSLAGALWVVQPHERVMRCLDVWHHPGVQVPEFLAMTRRISFGPGMGLPGRVWVTGKPVHTTTLDPSQHMPRVLVAQREGLRSGVAFPIQATGETVAVLEFFYRDLERPDAALTSMMAALGSQIGQVLERQRVEKALRDSETLYHSLVECLPQNVFRKDRQGRFTFANRNFCTTINRALGDLLGKTDFDFFPRELAAKYVRDDLHVMETGTVLEAVEEHILPEGNKIYVQVVKTPIRDAQGQIIGTQGLFWDVTARIQAEENLAASEKRYRQLTEATQDGIVVVDQHGHIALFNPAAERIFGYQAAEVVGKPVTVLMPEEYQPLHNKGFARFLETRQGRFIGRVVEVQGKRKDGKEFPMEIALSVLGTAEASDAQGRPAIQFLGAIRDLTERHQMRAVLVQNEKLAAIGLLSAGVAHEINNPLAFVANNLAVLERECKGLLGLVDLYHGGRERLLRGDPEIVHQVAALAEEIDLGYLQENLPRLLQRTREGVDRVSRIIHSLRSLARTESVRRQEVHVPDLVESNLDILRGRLKKSDITVEQEHDKTPRVTCVSSHISQVLLNLMVNAVQAIEATKRRDGKIVVRTRRLDHDLVIEVEDNGSGIEAAHLPKLFDPFFTTKEVGEGTGLGLSICHNLVVGHGGRIEVESRPGQGACFRVFLPLEHKRG